MASASAATSSSSPPSTTATSNPESLFLDSSSFSGLTVKLHATVIWSVLDQYVRRPEDSDRVIGALMGVNFEGLVEVRSCFPVPCRLLTHEGELTVVVDSDFYQNMFDLHAKAHPKEVLVGWYATGEGISEHSVVIHHDFFAPHVTHPLVHVTVNTDLRSGSLGSKAYVSQAIGFEPDKTLLTTFLPVHLELTAFEAERVGIDALLRARAPNSDSEAPLLGDLATLEVSLNKMLQMLDDVTQHITQRVLTHQVPADAHLGRYLADAVAALPRVDARQFEKMFHSSLQDLLMAVYLSNLTRAQLTLGERLQSL